MFNGSELTKFLTQKENTNSDLLEKIEKARHYVMTPKDVYEQRLSWIWGEINMNRSDDDLVSKDQIKALLAKQGIVDPQPE